MSIDKNEQATEDLKHLSQVGEIFEHQKEATEIAIEMVIKALEKQIPYELTNQDGDTGICKCGRVTEIIDGEYYCKYCGQKVTGNKQVTKDVTKTKKLLVVFDCDNGYSCSCCGKNWIETKLFELKDDEKECLRKYLKKLEKEVSKEYKRNNDYGRSSISEAYLVSEQIM